MCSFVALLVIPRVVLLVICRLRFVGCVGGRVGPILKDETEDILCGHAIEWSRELKYVSDSKGKMKKNTWVGDLDIK